MKRFPLNGRQSLAALALCGALAAGASAQQTQTPAQKPAAPAEGAAAPKQAAAAQGFKLNISSAAPRTFKLVSNKAKLTEVAAQISERLKVPVRVSPQLQDRQLTLDFSGLNLEAALRMLAPRPYVDYVAGGDDQGQPRPLAIYLYGAEEPPPGLNETIKNTSEAVLFEGDTEEGTEEYEKRKKEEPLHITFANNRVGVRARKQPLAVVVYKLASELGIPFELASDNGEVVDTEFAGYTFDQAMRALSPAVRFYYRADLLNFETYPIRVVLGGADSQAEAVKGGRP